MTDLAYSLRANEQLCRSLLDKCRPIISGAVTTIDLPADELAAVTAAIRHAIEDDRFPHAPRLDPLRAALARFDAAQIANDISLSKNGQSASTNGQAPKPTPDPKAPPPAKADKRARR
jgi:hypothetical protein